MSDPKIVSFTGTEPAAGGAPKSAMRSDLVEQAAAVVQDPPVLINMVSQRVRQLNNGRPPLIRVIERLGQADIALREIIEGKIVLSDGEITEFPGLEEE
tara:strand:- start:775 stop:1071 length:297 start_codon:yes stop_codon:yes gene_type:complete